MYNIKPIKTEDDYQAALKKVDHLWDAKPNTIKGDTLEILITLIEKYESEHFPIEAPDPIEAIKFVITHKRVASKDLNRILGGRTRVSEILNKKRKLNLRMMRNLHTHLHIPYDILIQDYLLNIDTKRHK